MKTLTLLFTLVVLQAFGGEAKGLVQLKAPLDEPEFYCLDVPGFRQNVQLDAPLMAHTCKPGAADEEFTINHPSSGQLFMEAYNRCVQAEGKQLYLKTCSEEARQRFLLASDGKLQVSGTDLCVAVGADKGTPTGGPSHLRRDLLLKPCSEASPELSRWTAPAKLAP